MAIAYRIVGWYGNIRPADRNPTTLSDGAIYSTMELVNQHIAKYQTTVLRIDRLELPAGDPQIDHLLRR
jgi:hypothetical protein